MKRRAVVLTLLATVALCALPSMAGSASATPAFGICRHDPGGKYEMANCTLKAVTPENEKYEWYPVVGEAKEEPALKEAGFELVFATTEPITFESSSKTVVECKKGTAKGSFSTHQTEGLTREVEKVVVEYGECTTAKTSCTSEGKAAGVMVTNSLDGILGAWKKEPETRHDKVGLALYPAPPESLVLSAECGTAKYEQQGGVIARVNATQINEPMESIEMQYVARGEEQRPGEFLTGEPKVEPFESMLFPGGWTETGLMASLAMRGFGPKGEGEVEVRAGVNET